MKLRVTRLPMDPGVSGWASILPDGRKYPELDESNSADFLVIGAGFAGLAAARRLMQLNPKSRIVVLEARTIAEGPAGRNSGFMIDLPHNLGSGEYASELQRDLMQTAMNREAIGFAGEAANEHKMSLEAFSPSGRISAAATQRGVDKNRDYCAHLSRMGEKFEVLDSAAMKELSGTSYYRSGLYTPGAVMIQPALFVRMLAEGLRRQGVSIHEKSPVTTLSRSGKAWLTATPRGTITAKRVILAVNGHVQSFGHFQRRLMHVYLYASMTRAMTKQEISILGGRQIWGFTPADPMGSTVRRLSGTGGDRLVIRNRSTWSPGRSVDPQVLSSIARIHDASFGRRFPNLANVEMQYRWGGLLCLSRNSVPAFGEIDENLFSACCQNGLGTVMGTLSGKLAAELASGHVSDSVTRLQELPSPRKLPPEPFASMGAKAYLRWLEFRAGREL